MKFLDKIFHPFGENGKNKYSGKYEDLSKDSQRVSPVPPSDLLLYCRDIAGANIQEFISKRTDTNWIRAEFTYPAFDSMNFMCGNQVFSVIIDIQDEEGVSYLPEHFIKRQLYASEEYNLIPCKFPVIVPDPYEPDYEKIKPKTNGLNLFNTKTDDIIYPDKLVTDEKIEISQWEMRNIGIKFILNYLKTKGYTIVSHQDTLEVDPQIWFKNLDDKKYWVIIRCGGKYAGKSNSDLKPEKLDEIIRRCFKYDGYYAEILFEPKNTSDKIYRGDSLKIIFNGLEKVHTTI